MKEDMNVILALTKRNLLLFFRDRSAVLFSFLGAIMILMLYILFLRENYTAPTRCAPEPPES